MGRLERPILSMSPATEPEALAGLDAGDATIAQLRAEGAL